MCVVFPCAWCGCVCACVFVVVVVERLFELECFKNIEKEEESLTKTVPKINQNH